MPKLKLGDIKLALDDIARKHGGRLTDENIVAEAEDNDHPLHNEFDWDDKTAAHKHRLAVAGALRRQVEYIGADVKGREVTATAWVYDPPTNSHVPLSKVARDAQESQNLMMQELAAIESHIRRAQRICDILHLRDDLDEMLHACIDLRERANKPTKKSKSKSRRKGGEARPHA